MPVEGSFHRWIYKSYITYAWDNQWYSSLKSIRRHLNKNHGNHNSREINREKRYETNESAERLNPQNTNIVDDISDNDYENKELNTDVNPLKKKTFDLIFDNQKIQEQINRMRTLFTLNWLSKDSISRKAAFDIQKDIQKYIIEPIKKTVEMMFNAGMLTDACMQILGEVLSGFDVASEYKYIEQLRTNNLYQDPTFFTISEELKPAVKNNQQCMVRLIFQVSINVLTS